MPMIDFLSFSSNWCLHIEKAGAFWLNYCFSYRCISHQFFLSELFGATFGALLSKPCLCQFVLLFFSTWNSLQCCIYPWTFVLCLSVIIFFIWVVFLLALLDRRYRNQLHSEVWVVYKVIMCFYTQVWGYWIARWRQGNISWKWCE